MLRRRNYYAVVTGANGVTYAMGAMPRKHAERQTQAWRESIGPATAVKRTRATARTLRRNNSDELASMLARLQEGAATS